jgi:hypothetical protein
MDILKKMGFEGVNEMIIEEVITGMLGHVEDKEMIKEKAKEAVVYLDKIPENMVVLITKLNGRVNACITEQENISSFKKVPEFIDIQSIIENVVKTLD